MRAVRSLNISKPCRFSGFIMMLVFQSREGNSYEPSPQWPNFLVLKFLNTHPVHRFHSSFVAFPKIEVIHHQHAYISQESHVMIGHLPVLYSLCDDFFLPFVAEVEFFPSEHHNIFLWPSGRPRKNIHL